MHDELYIIMFMSACVFCGSSTNYSTLNLNVLSTLWWVVAVCGYEPERKCEAVQC